MASRVRAHIRSNVVGYVALSVALLVAGGGAAIAAIPDSDDGEIHGCYDKSGTLRVIDAQAGATCTTGKETALVWNQEGPQGDPGTPGTPGSAGASALTGRVEGASFGGNNTTVFAEPNATSTYNSSENAVEHLSPNSTIVARDLAVKARLGSHHVFETTATFTLMDDSSATPVSCTLVGPVWEGPGPPPDEELSCNSGAATATISPASKLSLRITTSPDQATLTLPALFGWRAATP